MRAHYSVLRAHAGEERPLRLQAEDLVGRLRGDERLDHVEVSSGFRFVGDPGVLPALDHVVLRVWSGDPAALVEASGAIDAFGPSAAECWDLLVEPTRVQGGLGGFVPDTSGVPPLASEEHAVIHIQAVLTPEGMAPFYAAGPGVAAHALAHSGYLGGVGLSDTLADIASLSCWRTYADARAYAFSAGEHDRARRRGRTEMWNDPTTECYMRLRPLASTGTLHGSNPFVSLVEAAPAPASAGNGRGA